jgi:hypothetical protein
MATVTVRYSSISRARARRLQELTEEGGDGVSSVAQGDPNGGRILDCQGRRAGAGGVLREAAPGTVIHSRCPRGSASTRTPAGRRGPGRVRCGERGRGSLNNITPKRLMATSRLPGASRCVYASACSKPTLLRPSCRARCPARRYRAVRCPRRAPGVVRGAGCRASCRSGTAADVEDTIGACHCHHVEDEAGEGREHALASVLLEAAGE